MQYTSLVQTSKMGASSLSFDVQMLPYMTGIKPRDIVAIPSLKGPGDYIEDWEVQSVSYTSDDSGSVKLNITSERPYTGEKNMLDAGSISSIKSIVAGLTSPAAWGAFYWCQPVQSMRKLGKPTEAEGDEGLEEPAEKEEDLSKYDTKGIDNHDIGDRSYRDPTPEEQAAIVNGNRG